MKATTIFSILALLLALSVPVSAQDTNMNDHSMHSDSTALSSDSKIDSDDLKDANETAAEAAEVLDEVMRAEDKAIPKDILERAEVIAVFPSMINAGFIIGGRGGKGLVSIRDPHTRQWTAPVFLKMGGASFGAQIGGESTDLVLVGLNRDSADLFLKEKFELGAEASATAGPIGRTAAASTDHSFEGKLLSYSRSKGLFAGISIKGAKIKQDHDLNQALYGRKEVETIVPVSQRIPSGVMVFINALNRYTTVTPEQTGSIQTEPTVDMSTTTTVDSDIEANRDFETKEDQNVNVNLETQPQTEDQTVKMEDHPTVKTDESLTTAETETKVETETKTEDININESKPVRKRLAKD